MSDDLNRTPADETNAHLSGEDAQPHAAQPAAAQPGSGPTPVERAAETAREQAGEAASALRRGEFMQDAGVDPTADKDDKLIALLSYATQIVIPVVMPVIVLLSESSKKRPFQRYHAVQSLALMLLFVVIAVAVGIGTAIFQIVPLLGQLLGVLVLCLTPIAYLMAVVALLYYGYQAYQGKRFAIPGLTSFLRDQGWID
ncbi:MAG: hypothetical protein DCC57_13490 [Chloroflexi bacterium]|nr:MAG: hypothetical protein DCC57_13490 [Chloroflexota bacterium]